MTRKPPQFTQKKIRDRERATKAVELRVQGLTYQAIADTLGYSDRNSAQRSVDNLLKSVEVDSAEALRAQGQMRLEAIVKEMLPVVQDADYAIDDRVKAANVIIRAQETSNRMNGINKEPETPQQATSVYLVPSDLIPDETAKALSEAGEVLPGEEA